MLPSSGLPQASNHLLSPSPMTQIQRTSQTSPTHQLSGRSRLLHGHILSPRLHQQRTQRFRHSLVSAKDLLARPARKIAGEDVKSSAISRVRTAHPVVRGRGRILLTLTIQIRRRSHHDRMTLHLVRTRTHVSRKSKQTSDSVLTGTCRFLTLCRYRCAAIYPAKTLQNS